MMALASHARLRVILSARSDRRIAVHPRQLTAVAESDPSVAIARSG